VIIHCNIQNQQSQHICEKIYEYATFMLLWTGRVRYSKTVTENLHFIPLEVKTTKAYAYLLLTFFWTDNHSVSPIPHTP